MISSLSNRDSNFVGFLRKILFWHRLNRIQILEPFSVCQKNMNSDPQRNWSLCTLSQPHERPTKTNITCRFFCFLTLFTLHFKTLFPFQHISALDSFSARAVLVQCLIRGDIYYFKLSLAFHESMSPNNISCILLLIILLNINFYRGNILVTNKHFLPTQTSVAIPQT